MPDSRNTAWLPAPAVAHHWVFLVLSVAVIALAALLQTRDGRQVTVPLIDVPLPTTCTFRRLTGYGCPGCGLTRSFVCLVRGNVAQAWRFNPAGLLVFILVLAQIPYRALQLWRVRQGYEELRIRGGVWIVIALFGILLGQWLVRLVAQVVT